MPKIINISESEEKMLLTGFNNRDICALSNVYDLCYLDMIYYITILLKDTEIESCDIFHDVLLRIWEKRDLRFDTIKSLKSYLYVSIRNNMYNQIVRSKRADTYSKSLKTSYIDSSVDVAETEIISLLHEAISYMPNEMADIFTLIMQGYDVKDISQKLGRSQSYVYNQRNAGISLIKEKVKKNNSFIILLISQL